MVQLESPWNGKVNISYTVTGDIAGIAKERGLATSLKVTATDNTSNETYTAMALSGDLGLSAGPHSLVWDMTEDNIDLIPTNFVFCVSCEKTLALYCVVDLTEGSNATSYPVTYLAEQPSGGFNTDEYKTTKLVLRRIEPGTYMMQNSSNVTLTKPFYIGLFEMTQKQYQLVMGNNPSYYSGDNRPVDAVNYNTLRGSSNGAKWPSSSGVDSGSFMGKFQVRTGLAFDLPTEAQWEYACRAGTTSSYNNGGNDESDLRELGRYNGNTTDGKGGFTTHTTVGSYEANAWGLYDMHGNIMEWCLDWVGTRSYGTDPKGPSSGSYRIARGGSWWRDAAGCTSSNWYKRNPSDTNYEYGYGFRLVRTLSSVETAGTLCSRTVSPWWRKVVDFSFDANGGTGEMNAQTAIEGDTLVLASNAFVRVGYHFQGWSAKPNDDVLYTDGTTIPDVPADMDGATLYAVWKPCMPEITPAENSVFANASETVSISHDGNDVVILYTTDGSDPTEDGREYKGGFPIYDSCTIRVVAYGAGRYSDEACVTLTRTEGLSEAVNLYG